MVLTTGGAPSIEGIRAGAAAQHPTEPSTAPQSELAPASAMPQGGGDPALEKAIAVTFFLWLGPGPL